MGRIFSLLLALAVSWPAAAQTFFRDMVNDAPVATSPMGTAKLPIVQGDVTKSVTPLELSTQVGPTFNAYGALGDGTTDDRAAMNAALAATAGGTIYGSPGSIYVTSSELFIPANTTIDCRGATIKGTGPRILRAGTSGTQLGVENVTIRNCTIWSESADAIIGVTPYTGTRNLRIVNNVFRDSGGHKMTALSIRQSNVSEVWFERNVAENVQYGVYLDGDETQVWTLCNTILTSTTSGPCGTPATPAPGTATFTIPADGKALMDTGNYGIGVVAHMTDPEDNYRIYGPDEYRTTGPGTFSYNTSSGVITFNDGALPTVGVERIRYFVWNKTTAPANNLQDIKILDNTFRATRGASVQVNCPVHSLNVRVPFQDCMRGIKIDGNYMDMPPALDNTDVGTAGNPKNLLRWSQDFTNAVWGFSNASVSGTYAAPPYVTEQTATKMIEADFTGNHHVDHQIASLTAGQPYVFSLFLNPRERSKVRVLFRGVVAGSPTDGATARWDLANCTNTSVAATGAGASVAAGAMSFGLGWCRIWVTAVMPASTVAFADIYLEDNAGAISYDGNGTSGFLIWGGAVQKAAAPDIYYPTEDVATLASGATVISLNGTSGCTITNNIFGTSVGQQVHLEDWVNNCVISGNTFRDAGAAAIYLTQSAGAVVSDNTFFNMYDTCVTLHSRLPPAKNIIDTVIQNRNAVLTGNLCDLNSNPAAVAAYSFSAETAPFTLTYARNTAINLPSGATTLAWQNNADQKLSTEDFPVALLTARLGTCDATRPGQRRQVSDAIAPTYGGTLVGGGAIYAMAICDGVSAWKTH